VDKPGFTFNNCKIYGSVVHGYNAANDQEATKFIGCLFEDKPYNGIEPYGSFLVESNYKRRLRLENCTLIANKKKFFWMEIQASLPANEKYQIKNCKFFSNGKNIPQENFESIPFVNFSK
jgi:hypothetical protein